MSEKNAQRNFFERADNAGRFAETALLSVILAAMILLATYQITLRNFFAAGLPWADEALRIMVLWLAMLGAARLAMHAAEPGRCAARTRRPRPGVGGWVRRRSRV